MAKRKADEAFVDLTLDSDDDAPALACAHAPAMSAERSGSSPTKPLPVGATPATMRSREIVQKLKALGVTQLQINACSEKRDLLNLLSRHQTKGLNAKIERSNPPLHSTPPTNVKINRPGSVGGVASSGAGAPALCPNISPHHQVPAYLSAPGFSASRQLVSPTQARASLAQAQARASLALQARASVTQARASLASLPMPAGSFIGGRPRCSRCGRKRRRCTCALTGGLGAGTHLGGGAGGGIGGSYGGGEGQPSAREENEDMDVGLSHKDADEQTFTEYVPHTFSAPVFQRHPDPVVETASLSSLVPPKTTHKLRLCAKTITQGLLTNLQLEAINLACQQHELRLPRTGARAAFFMGDGPGVGKGRQAAGIIFENFLHGRKKALWLSVSGDLVVDARRDLDDIGAGQITCYNLKDFKPSMSLDAQGVTEGVLFSTYSLLTSERAGAAKVEHARLDQIIQWCCAGSFDGVLVLDECHRAKNMGNGKARSDKMSEDRRDDLDAWKKQSASKSALFVASLQEQLPLSRIVYLSATGASDPKHFCQMSRLGLWGPGTAFADQFDFIDEMHKGGIGAMELVAMHMKGTGQYLARSLSFKDASFEIVEVKLTDDFKRMYDKAVEVWQKLIAHPLWWTRPSANGTKPRNMMGLLWSAHLRFFSQMVMAAKVPEVVELVKKSLDEGMCCVIGLQTTGEAAGSAVEENADALFSNAANAILKLVEDYCTPERPRDKELLLEEIRSLKLPPNPLDDLISLLGGPAKVAEMTGRSVRWVKSKNGCRERWKLTKRVRDDRGEHTVNVEERKLFQAGRKLIAVISEAASSGISLQADRRCGNQRRRVHITLQLPWSSDQIVQQMGRSHRSNQSSAPLFKLMMTPIGGEWRFASAVAKRLQALGALTQGDRRASGTGGSSIQAYNIENYYGLKALKDLMQEVLYGAPVNSRKGTPDFVVEAFPSVLGPDDSMRQFLSSAAGALDAAGFSEVHFNKANSKLKTFLNRVLGVKLDLQNVIFRYFMWLMSERIKQDQNNGEYQEGIVDIAGSVIELVRLQDLFECPRTGAKTQRALLRTDRGLSWDKAKEMLAEHREYAESHHIEDVESGFYSSADAHDHVAGAKPIVLILKQRTTHNVGKMRASSYHIVRPNTGHSSQTYDNDYIAKNFVPSDPASPGTKDNWDRLFSYYERNCGHKICYHSSCSYKKRTTNHNIIVGLVLPFWKEVKKVMKNAKVVRVQPTDGSKRLVGLRIWPDRVDEVCDLITRGGAADDQGDYENRLQRIVNSPFQKIISTVAIHDCLNPAARDTVSFDLPPAWNVDPSGAGGVHCMVLIFEIPLQNALLDQKAPLRPARWRSDGQLRVLDERTMQETVIPVSTAAVPRTAVICKPVNIDTYVKEGNNKLRVQSIGERFCVVVQLVSERQVDDVVKDMSVVADAAQNLEWGKTALLKQLGHGEDQDDDLVVTELDVSLKDPLSCARIQTPARGKECQHFTCFDLGIYLQYAARYGTFKCQICSKELNPNTVTVCKRFQTLLDEVDPEADSCKLNAQFEISNAHNQTKKDELPAAEGGGCGDDKEGGGGEDEALDCAAAAPAGTPEEQLAQTNLWEYTEEAERAFRSPGLQDEHGHGQGDMSASASGGAACSGKMPEDGNGEADEESEDDAPILALGRRGRALVRRVEDSEEASDFSGSETSGGEEAGADGRTTDDEGCSNGSDGKQPKGGQSGSRGLMQSKQLSSRPLRASRAKPIRYEDPATDDDEEDGDSDSEDGEERGSSSGGKRPKRN